MIRKKVFGDQKTIEPVNYQTFASNMFQDDNLLVQSRAIRHEYIHFVLPKIIDEDAEYKIEALSI